MRKAIFLTILFSFSGQALAAYHLGYRPTPPDLAKKFLIKEKMLISAESLPRSVNLCDQLPPVGNQGSQGSCVAWAIGYYYKSFQEGKEHNWDFSDESQICSPAFIYNQINGGEDGGSVPSDALLLLTREGCDNLKDMPYNDSDYLTLPTKEQYINAFNWKAKDFYFFFYEDNDPYTGERYHSLSNTVIDELKSHLANGDVFVMSIPVYTSFFYLDENNYFFNGPADNDKYEGGHAIVICGYDDDAGNGTGGFILRNSWGTNWGKDGEAYLSYDFVKNYAFEAAAMTDRINYSWSRAVWVNATSIYRDSFNATVSDDNGTSLPIMGDYSYQKYLDDTREGVSIAFDISDLSGESQYYYLKALDMNEDGNSGNIEEFSLITDSYERKSDDTPKEIPDNGQSVTLKVLNCPDCPTIDSFNASNTEGPYPLNVIFSYKITNEFNKEITINFDADGDGEPERKITTTNSSIEGSDNYTFSQPGTYNATLTVLVDNFTLKKVIKINAEEYSPNIKALFSLNSIYIPSKLEIKYSISDVNNDLENCRIDLGDGSFRQIECGNGTLSYTYNYAGRYTVKIEASDGIKTSSYVKVINLFDKKSCFDANLSTNVELKVDSGRISEFKFIKPAEIKGYRPITGYSFKLEGVKGGKTTVLLRINRPISESVHFLKGNIDITDKVLNLGDTIKYTIYDNGFLDSNKNKGVIEDPLILAKKESQTESSASGGGGGGCSLSAVNSESRVFNLLLELIPLFVALRRKKNLN